MSEASSFCLAETAEGIAKKVQPAVFLFVSVFLSAARKKNEKPSRLERKKLYRIERLYATILMAVIAPSSPLLPNLPPARSSACSMVLVVMSP